MHSKKIQQLRIYYNNKYSEYDLFQVNKKKFLQSNATMYLVLESKITLKVIL
jgi:hypothetical protein